MGRSPSDSPTDSEMEISNSNKRARDSPTECASHKRAHNSDSDNTQYRVKHTPTNQQNYQYTVALDKIPQRLLTTQKINKSLSNSLVSRHILRAKLTQNRKTLLLLAKNVDSFNYLNTPAIWRDSQLFEGTAEPRRPINNNNIAHIFGIADELDDLKLILSQQFDGITHITQLHNTQKQKINIIAVHFQSQKHLAIAIAKRTFLLHFMEHQICPATSIHYCRLCYTYQHKTANCTLKQPLPPVNKTCFTCKSNDHRTFSLKCPAFKEKTRELEEQMRRIAGQPQTGVRVIRPFQPSSSETETEAESDASVEQTTQPERASKSVQPKKITKKKGDETEEYSLKIEACIHLCRQYYIKNASRLIRANTDEAKPRPPQAPTLSKCQRTKCEQMPNSTVEFREFERDMVHDQTNRNQLCQRFC